MGIRIYSNQTLCALWFIRGAFYINLIILCFFAILTGCSHPRCIFSGVLSLNDFKLISWTTASLYLVWPAIVLIKATPIGGVLYDPAVDIFLWHAFWETLNRSHKISKNLVTWINF